VSLSAPARDLLSLVPQFLMSASISMRCRGTLIDRGVLHSDGDRGPLRMTGATSARSAPTWAAASQGNHAIFAQNANGLEISIKRRNASKEGTTCKLIEICSASPPGDGGGRFRCQGRAGAPSPWLHRCRASDPQDWTTFISVKQPLPTIHPWLVRIMVVSAERRFHKHRRRDHAANEGTAATLSRGRQSTECSSG
jgi:hypothetical protein